MKAFRDLDFRGGPVKTTFWTISILALGEIDIKALSPHYGSMDEGKKNRSMQKIDLCMAMHEI
jgi:hypothetical protein